MSATTVDREAIARNYPIIRRHIRRTPQVEVDGSNKVSLRGNGNVVVTYAKQDADREDDVPCPGCGFVDVFNTHGQLLRRLVSRGNLNAPWGLEIANGQLWVGNFGDGRINVYDPGNGSFIGRPKDIFNIPLQFDGLWGLLLVDGGMYFTAGITDEEHGIFGVIF